MKLRLPDIDLLVIEHFTKDTLHLDQFLLKCMPVSLRELRIESNSIFPFDKYCSGFKNAVSRVKSNLILNKIEINEKTFKRMIKSSNHMDTIEFLNCNIDTINEIDLSGPEYK